MNRANGQACKEKCGLLGVGAKLSLNYTFNAPGLRQSSLTPTSKTLRSRNLDGEAGDLIRPKPTLAYRDD